MSDFDLGTALKEMEISLPKGTERSLIRLRDLVLDAPFNVVGTTGADEFDRRHLLDSISALPHLPDTGTVVDIGSGAGLPCLPLAIARPDLLFLAVESVKKKAEFIQSLVRDLDLERRVQVRRERAETFGQDASGRELFDAVVIRALGSVSECAELGLPLLRIGGRVILYRAREVEAEVDEGKEAVSLLGGAVEGIHPVDLPGTPPLTRHLVILAKVAPTPEKYPRRPGIPGKRPL